VSLAGNEISHIPLIPPPIATVAATTLGLGATAVILAPRPGSATAGGVFAELTRRVDCLDPANDVEDRLEHLRTSQKRTVYEFAEADDASTILGVFIAQNPGNKKSPSFTGRKYICAKTYSKSASCTFTTAFERILSVSCKRNEH
jgi:hypothetical protein